MKFGVVKQSTTVNRFVLHNLQCNITHLAVITRKTSIKLGILKGGGGGNWKRARKSKHTDFGPEIEHKTSTSIRQTVIKHVSVNKISEHLSREKKPYEQF